MILQPKNILKIAALLMVIIMQNGCDSPNTSINSEITEIEAENDVISITKAQFAQAKMAMGNMEERPFYTIVKANGFFDVPPENRASVSVYYGGYIKEINLLPGQDIKKGQRLFTIENPDFIKIQQEFLEADGQLKYLKADYERQSELSKENIASQKSFLKAESDYKVTLARQQSLKKQLELMNINTTQLQNGQLTSTLSILAPISGSITSVNAVRGQYVNPTDVAVTISDNSHMHVELKVFEGDIVHLKKGQSIRFSIPSLPDRYFKAEIYLINSLVENEQRTTIVHGHFKNEADAQLFVPGMYLESEVLTETKNLYALPEQAIVEIENEYFALVLNANSTAETYYFNKVKINQGGIQNGYTAILNVDDFNKNSVFLTRGVFDVLGE